MADGSVPTAASSLWPVPTRCSPIYSIVRRFRRHWPPAVITVRGGGHYGRREALENIGIVFLSKNATLGCLGFCQGRSMRRRSRAKLELVRSLLNSSISNLLRSKPRRSRRRRRLWKLLISGRADCRRGLHCPIGLPNGAPAYWPQPASGPVASPATTLFRPVCLARYKARSALSIRSPTCMPGPYSATPTEQVSTPRCCVVPRS